MGSNAQPQATPAGSWLLLLCQLRSPHGGSRWPWLGQDRGGQGRSSREQRWSRSRGRAEAQRDVGAEVAPHLPQAPSGQECPSCVPVCPSCVPVLLPPVSAAGARRLPELCSVQNGRCHLCGSCSNGAALVTLARAHVHTAACQEDIYLCSPFSLASVLPFGDPHVPSREVFGALALLELDQVSPSSGMLLLGAGVPDPERCLLPTWCH